MYICMHACMYVNIYIYTYTYIYMYIQSVNVWNSRPQNCLASGVWGSGPFIELSVFLKCNDTPFSKARPPNIGHTLNQHTPALLTGKMLRQASQNGSTPSQKAAISGPRVSISLPFPDGSMQHFQSFRESSIHSGVCNVLLGTNLAQRFRV